MQSHFNGIAEALSGFPPVLYFLTKRTLKGNHPLNGQISQDEINAILWRACDTFRGTLDPAEYKNYILVMLFVKYISDAWRDHYDAYRAQLGDDEARIRRRMGFEKFKLPERADFPR